jgi:hypothetical protein
MHMHMHTMISRTPLIAVALAVLSAAAPANEPAATPAVPAPPAAAAPAAALPLAPRLNIVWACNECQSPNDKVPPLIEKAYAAEAAKAGRSVSAAEVAEVAIVDFRQRPPGVRAAFGMMAGSDRLRVTVRYKDREFTAEETSASALFGMNSLCEAVGRSAFQQLFARP